MERVRRQVDGRALVVGYHHRGRILAWIEFRLDPEAGVGGRCPDEVDDDLMADQRAATPGQADVGAESVLELVPRAGPGWQVTHGHRQAAVVGELLPLALPQPDPLARAPPAISADEQSSGLAVGAHPYRNALTWSLR